MVQPESTVTEQRLRNEGIPVMCLWDIHQGRLSIGESNRGRSLKFYRIYIPVALVLHFFKIIKYPEKSHVFGIESLLSHPWGGEEIVKELNLFPAQ